MESYYTRYDKYSIDVGINPAAWMEDFSSPFSFGLSAGSELVFARQFKTQKDSAIALPYSPYNLPVTAERAIERLSSGDFVAFQTNLSLMVSVGSTIPAYHFLTLSGATHAYIKGNFLVHIFKISDTKIRLKFIALSANGGDTGLSASIAGAGIQSITGIAALDGKIKDFIHFDALTVAKDINLTDLFLIDYVLDLKNPKVAQAYTNIMTTKLAFKSSELINPLENRETLAKDLITDLSELETIFQQEKSKEENQRAVHRIFKGSIESVSQNNNYKFGLNLVRFEGGSYYSESKIANLDNNDQPQRFLFDTFSKLHQKKFLFQLFDESENVNANLLFTTNADFTPDRFVALVLSRDVKSKTISKNGINDLKLNLRKVLPEFVYNKIQWKDWDYDLLEKVNIYFRHQISFPTAALVAIPSLEEASVRVRYQKFLESIPAPSAIPSYTPPSSSEAGSVGAQNDLDRYAQDLDFISGKLATAFNSQLGPVDRYKSFVQLKGNELFLETGAGFLISLLPQDQLEKLINYQMELSGKGGDRVLFKYGLATEENLYKSLLYVQNVLNNRSIDLRLLKESAPEEKSSAQ